MSSVQGEMCWQLERDFIRRSWSTFDTRINLETVSWDSPLPLQDHFRQGFHFPFVASIPHCECRSKEVEGEWKQTAEGTLVADKCGAEEDGKKSELAAL